MKSTQDKMQIAKEILRQLGGNKFIVMTGVKHITSGKKSLQFQIMRNKGKYKGVVITLNSLDLYDVKFWKLKKVSPAAGAAPISDVTYNVYGDTLQELFTSKTGLDTHL